MTQANKLKKKLTTQLDRVVKKVKKHYYGYHRKLRPGKTFSKETIERQLRGE